MTTTTMTTMTTTTSTTTTMTTTTSTTTTMTTTTTTTTMTTTTPRAPMPTSMAYSYALDVNLPSRAKVCNYNTPIKGWKVNIDSFAIKTSSSVRKLENRHFDANSGKWTVPIDGLYQCCVSAKCAKGHGHCDVTVSKNGDHCHLVGKLKGCGTSCSMDTCFMDKLKGGDKIQVNLLSKKCLDTTDQLYNRF